MENFETKVKEYWVGLMRPGFEFCLWLILNNKADAADIDYAVDDEDDSSNNNNCFLL